MSISPFSARPTVPGGESRRARLVLLIAIVGIGATIMAYAVSPGVRHAVSHAAHSVKNGVTRVVDPDAAKRRAARHALTPLPAARHAKAKARHKSATGSQTSTGAAAAAP